MAGLALLLLLCAQSARTVAAALELPLAEPTALVWDGARQRGAVAAAGKLVLIGLPPAGAGADALVALATLDIGPFSTLVLGQDDGRFYGSDAAAGTLSVIDPVARALLARFPAGGPQPVQLLHQPVLHRLISFNQGANTVTAFDLGSQAFEGLIPLGDTPVSVRMAPDGRMLALLPERRELVLIGVRPLRIFARWSLPEECPRASDLAVDSAGLQVFVACGAAAPARFDLRTAEWQPGRLVGAAGAAIRRVLWDARTGALLLVADDGDVSAASPGDGYGRLVAHVPAGSLVELDAASDRLVWVQDREGRSLRLGLTALH